MVCFVLPKRLGFRHGGCKADGSIKLFRIEQRPALKDTRIN